MYDEDLGSKSNALLNDNGHTSIHPDLQTSELASTQPSSKGRSKAAFTLAEVLITLGIIGVVAALTLPALVAKQQEKATVSRLKKVYSTLSQAYLFAVAEYGPPQDWGFAPVEEIEDEDNNVVYDVSGIEQEFNILSKFMKGKRCDNLAECLGKSSITAYNLSKTTSNVLSTSMSVPFPHFILDDGTVIAFTNVVSADCTKKWTNEKFIRCADIEVFFPNGRGEMHRGVNNFMFSLTRDGIFPAGRIDVFYPFSTSCTIDKAAVSATNGHGCSAWVIYNENMDYLHCSDLSWDGKTKCR